MKAPEHFNVGLVQMACGTRPEENLGRAVTHVREAAQSGAQVICLPELFRTPYFCQEEDAARFELAESIPGPSTEAFSAVASELGISVLVPIFERRSAGIYHNTVVIMDVDGRQVGCYRKMHIPNDPGYYEKFYFTPSDLGFEAVTTAFGSIGALICWDQWYPEAARLTALQGAAALFYPTAIGWLPGEKEGEGAEHLDAWKTVQRAHAIANGVYVAAVNRVGTEKNDSSNSSIEFWGSSFIADPFGKILAEAPIDKEAVLIAEVNLAHIEATRRTWPFLRDRRIDAYGGITQQFLDPS